MTRRLVISIVSLLLWIPSAAVQTSAQAPAPVVTIDGSREPDRIPEWILWREIFRAATMLSERSPTRGEDIWVARAGLSLAQMNQMIARGQAFRFEESALESLAGDLRTQLSGDQLAEALARLKADKERKILEHRDQLRSGIGLAAFNKLAAFARKQIAPGIRVGEMAPVSGAAKADPR